MKKLIICDWNRTLYDPDNNCLFPDTLPFLEGLKNNILFLVSTNELNTSVPSKNPLISRYFKKIIVGQPKTRRLFLNIKKEFPTFEAWVVGDRIGSEIKAGNQAGCITIRIKQGKFSSEAPLDNSEIPDATVLNLMEAAEILRS